MLNYKTNMTESITTLNKMIVNAHMAHYVNSITGLLIQDESPNGNIMYHLYSTGEITYQKGGWAYKKRNEFLSEYEIIDANKSFSFPLKTADKTYVILTPEECIKFRKRMVEILK